MDTEVILTHCCDREFILRLNETEIISQIWFHRAIFSSHCMLKGVYKLKVQVLVYERS